MMMKMTMMVMTMAETAMAATMGSACPQTLQTSPLKSTGIWGELRKKLLP
jgi:hypothetical protein